MDTKHCIYCVGEIPSNATVCRHCMRDQNWVFGKFHADRIGLFVSVVMMLVAIFQLLLASQQLTTAQEALNEAQIAREDVSTLERQAFSIINEMQNAVSQNLKLTLDAVSTVNDAVFRNAEDEALRKKLIENYKKIFREAQGVEQRREHLSQELSRILEIRNSTD